MYRLEISEFGLGGRPESFVRSGLLGYLAFSDDEQKVVLLADARSYCVFVTVGQSKLHSAPGCGLQIFDVSVPVSETPPHCPEG
jgi:hypothetical protein